MCSIDHMKQIKVMQKTIMLFFFGQLVFSCKGTPEQLDLPVPMIKEPVISLSESEIHDLGPANFSGSFILHLENPGTEPVLLQQLHHDTRVNDNTSDQILTEMENSFPRQLDRGARITIPLNVSFPSHIIQDSDEYVLDFSFELIYLDANDNPLSTTLQVTSNYPRIREPVFSITNIAVKRAELINTRLVVSIQIDNPNCFPVDLSDFEYELFGNGRYWAGGDLVDILHVPAKGNKTTDLYLIMNFINMKRDLLDQIIALQNVQYRFKGSASVATPIQCTPYFLMDFDRNGYSAVYE